MATITTLRPSADSSGVGWSAEPSGDLWEVTSDDSDSTYAEWSGDGSALILATPPDAPPVGERRHMVRLRARGQDGDAWWAVRLANGALVAGAAGSFGTSPETVVGSWQAGAPPDGSTTLSAYVTGQASAVKIMELYLDVDSREAPTLVGQVLDGSGSSTVTVSDTVTPTIRASAVDLDGLAARQFRYWVTLDGVTVWDTGVVSGPSGNRQTTPLENGVYVAHLQVWSTLGTNTAYASTVAEVEFTMAVGEVAQPPAPTVTPEPPFYRVEVCGPDASEFDDYVSHVELQRVDCQGQATTLVILGPLESDECAEWVDFTFPRSGVGITCNHQPEPCCSFYRARTVARVDGSLLVSNWSDAWNPGVPEGLIFAWPGENSAIPSGWERVTALDGRYPKSIPDGATNPGATGGASLHLHTTPGHTHGLDHSHIVTTTTSGPAVGTFNGSDGVSGTAGYPASHTHTTAPNTLASDGVESGSATPGTSAVTNDPSRLEVIWIESNGNPLGIPPGTLALMGDISPSGWDTYADGTDRYLKGAPAGADGGGIFASALSNHAHLIDSHTHGGTAHTHDNSNTGNTSGSLSFFAGANPATWIGSHNHPVTVSSSSTAGLDAADGGTSGESGELNPPFHRLRLRENALGVDDLPVGVIGLWRNSIGSIPDKFQLCDGTNGTPDLFGFYPRASDSNIGATGGSLDAHNHTSPDHTHETTGHSHSRTAGPAGTSPVNLASGGVPSVLNTHTHVLADTDSDEPSVTEESAGTLSSTTTEPLHEEVAFVQLMEEWAPPPAPPTFCLEWSDDEHLIRTLTPSGPIWAPVLGKFEWTKDRPFTAATGVNGSRFVTSAAPGGRNLHMVAAVESEEELAELRAVLARPLVLISPSDASEVWAAPVMESVRVVKVGRIRQVTADFIGTGPEPAPQLADVGG